MEITAKQIADQNTILRSTVGSKVHGLNLEGTDDRDEMGVCIESLEYVIGLKKFEQYVFRTQPEGKRSQPGDLDLTIYSLRKWCRLALGGNPTILLLLFTPDDAIIKQTPLGKELQELHWAFACRKSGKPFLGYLTAQKERLLGLRGQKRVKRPELEAETGYDTKYAMHMVRLGFQGVEFLKTGKISLPMPDEERKETFAIRQGERDIQQVLTLTGELESEIEDLLETSQLPLEPDYDTVNDFLIKAYQK